MYRQTSQIPGPKHIVRNPLSNPDHGVFFRKLIHNLFPSFPSPPPRRRPGPRIERQHRPPFGKRDPRRLFPLPTRQENFRRVVDHFDSRLESERHRDISAVVEFLHRQDDGRPALRPRRQVRISLEHRVVPASRGNGDRFEREFLVVLSDRRRQRQRVAEPALVKIEPHDISRTAAQFLQTSRSFTTRNLMSARNRCRIMTT